MQKSVACEDHDKNRWFGFLFLLFCVVFTHLLLRVWSDVCVKYFLQLQISQVLIGSYKSC